MKTTLDHPLLRALLLDSEKVLPTLNRLGIKGEISWDWGSFLTYLDLGHLLQSLPALTQMEPLFSGTISTLNEIETSEELFHVYDSLFILVLKKIKALQEVDSSFLLSKIREKKESHSFKEVEKFFLHALEGYEKSLKEDPHGTIHDLILYLAWNEICGYLSELFDHPSNHPLFLENLKKLKKCLIESYQHITQGGEKNVSFSSLMEAVFYYQMREERLPLHSKENWDLLTQSFPLLKGAKQLSDFFYIDSLLHLESNKEDFRHLTIDSLEHVQSRRKLAIYMMEHCKNEVPGWSYHLPRCQVIHFS